MITGRAWRTPEPLGPGGRWRVAGEVSPDTILVVLDDDVCIALAPRAVESLARSVEERGGAAGAQGITPGGRAVPWGADYEGDLVCAGAATLAVRAGDLADLEAMADEVQTKCGFDPLGDCGDDEALVSACLWRRGVPTRYARVEGLLTSPETQAGSQTRKRLARGEAWDAQRRAISRATGWPWPSRRG